MNTLELLHDLSRFICGAKTTSNYGVYACDELPKEKLIKPALIIANLSDSSSSGSHWVGFYFRANSNKGEFFDSFGKPPTLKVFKNFIAQNCTSYIYNNHKLQSNWSSCCGNYAILFLYFRCKQRSMRSFIKEFDVHQPEQNDVKIMEMYAKMSQELQKKMRCKKYKNQIGGNCKVITCMQTCVPLNTRHEGKNRKRV